MEQTKAPDTNPSEEWADLPWRKLEHTCTAYKSASSKPLLVEI